MKYMKTCGKVLLAIIVLELSLGGGGRWMDVAGMPRIGLFLLGVGYFVIALLLWPLDKEEGQAHSERVPREFLFLVGLFIALGLTSLSVSVLNGESYSEAASGLRPQMYFLLLPFFALTMRNIDDVVLISGILKFSALTLAVLFISTIAVWKTGFITDSQIVGWLNPHHDPRLEVFFRGGTTFFFKAVLYVGVAVFFFVVEKNRNWRGVVLMLLLAIGLTMTRSVWLAIFLVLAAWAFFCTAERLKGIMLAVGLLLAGVMGVVLINETLPSVVQSNAIRLNDLKAIPDAMMMEDAMMMLFGHGFGTRLLGREAIEITYVNVFIKQGLIGIIFWFLPAVYLAWQMRLIRDAALRSLAMPYFLAAVFVYVVSFANPFLSSAIGISVVMIAMVAVRVIAHSGSKRQPEPM